MWLAAGLLAVSLLCGAAVSAQSKSKKPKKDAPYALLFGTVFTEQGRLARGVSVVVRQKEGKKKWEALSDGQGEFAVRLPPQPAVYRVRAHAPSVESAEAEASFTADERQDVVLRLSRKLK